MMEAPDTARLTAPIRPLPPMPPPVLVAIWTASDIQLNSPASDTTASPGWSESSSTGIVVPWIVSSMASSSVCAPIVPWRRCTDGFIRFRLQMRAPAPLGLVPQSVAAPPGSSTSAV